MVLRARSPSPWLLVLLSPLLALAACSSSSGSGGAADGSTADATGNADGAIDTGAPQDSGPGADTSSVQDSATADAGGDGALPLCGPDAGCVTGTFCCVGASQGFCDQSCACWTALGCANAAQCPVTTDVCCIQPTSVGCSAGAQQSVCLASCNGLTQLCDPSAPVNECLVGQCTTSGATLKMLKIPVDAGYGVCH